MKSMFSVFSDYAQMTVGAVMVAVSIVMFLEPNDVVVGGITGVAILLKDFLGTPVGIISLVANIPLFALGFRRLGGFVFGMRTLYATTVMSLAIDLLAPYLKPVTADPLLYTLYGGILDGIGVGLVFRARGTTGGIDIIARMLENRGIQPGRSLLLMNGVVFGVALFAFGPEKVLYAVLVAFVSGLALDYTMAAGSGARQALIITSLPDAITRALLTDLGRGVTVLEGYGGYTGTERCVLLSVVRRTEISFLKEIVHEVDPRAFVIIGEASEVIGEGFRPFGPGRPLPPVPVALPEEANSEG